LYLPPPPRTPTPSYPFFPPRAPPPQPLLRFPDQNPSFFFGIFKEFDLFRQLPHLFPPPAYHKLPSLLLVSSRRVSFFFVPFRAPPLPRFHNCPQLCPQDFVCVPPKFPPLTTVLLPISFVPPIAPMLSLTLSMPLVVPRIRKPEASSPLVYPLNGFSLSLSRAPPYPLPSASDPSPPTPFSNFLFPLFNDRFFFFLHVRVFCNAPRSLFLIR